MARGFLGGLVIGGAVSVAGAGILSVVAFPPSAPQPSAPEQTAAEETTSEQNGSEQTGEASAAIEPSPQPETSVDAEPDTALPTDQEETPAEASPAPEVVSEGPEPVAPAALPDTSPNSVAESASPAGEALAQEGAPALQAPAQDSGADIDTTPPTVTADTSVPADAPTAPDVPNTDGGVDVAADTPILPAPQAAAPNPPDADATASVSTEPAQPSVQEPEPAPEDTAESEAPAPEPAPETTEPDIAETETPAEDAVTDQDPETAEAAPSPTPEPETATETAQAAPAGRPTIGTPATNLLERRSGSRLPTASTVGVQNDAAAPAEVAAAPDSGAGALERYAAAFDDPQNRPRLSIILMDNGQDLGNGPVGLAALGSFPYALTFAVDAGLPDAKDRVAQYRAQGFEVMALVDLPPAATAADTEVNLAAALDAVPEAVGILEGTEGGLQPSPEVSNQVTEIAAASGLGVVWQPKGLDTAQKLAARAGVPSLTLFRDFDSAGQTPTVIRRFLDQAAFKAGQQDGVIMVGRLRPDTISALLLWGLQDRAARVAVAPVSAVLDPDRD